MALSQEQQRIIEAALEHLLEFPAAQDEFVEQEKKLLHALSNPVEQEHDYYWLRECYYQPEIYFQSIAKLGSNVTIGDIQTHILQYATACLHKPGIPLQQWNLNDLLQTIPESNQLQIFTDGKAPVDGGEHPQQLPVLTDSIYTQTMRQETIANNFAFDIDVPHFTVTRIAHVTVTVDCPDISISETIRIEELGNHFLNDNEDDRYIARTKKDAELAALNFAANIAIQFLSATFDLTSLAEQLNKSKPAKLVMTNRFWFDQLGKNIISPAELTSLTPQQADNLTNRIVISLYNSNVLSFTQAKQLSSAAKLVATHHVYFKLLNENKIHIQDILDLTGIYAKLLIHPFVTDLIQRGKITLQQVKNIPPHLFSIMKNTGYHEFFFQHPINWDEFIKIPATHCDLLFQPFLEKMVLSQVLTFNTFASLLNQYSEKNDLLFHCIATALANRLLALSLNLPFEFHSRADHIDAIMQDLRVISAEHQLNDREALKIMLHKFLCNLKSTLKCKINSSEAINKQFEVMLCLSIELEKLDSTSPSNTLKIFPRIVAFAEQTRIQMRVQSFTSMQSSASSLSVSAKGVFAAASSDVSTEDRDFEIKSFCDRLIELSPLLHIIKPTPVPAPRPCVVM